MSISNADNAPDVARDGEHPPATLPPAASPLNVTLDLTPAWAAHGGDVRLEWRSEGAERCVAEGAWSGALPLNGDAVVQDVATDSTFVVRCSSGVHDAMAMKGVGVRHATLTWQEVDADGAHPGRDTLVGFRLYHGLDDGPLEPLDEPLSYDSRRWHVELPPGTHRWAIAPIGPDGSEGALSNVVEKWIR